MLVLVSKESQSFYRKSELQMFLLISAAILVDQNGPPIWRLLAWNVSANSSETVGHKDLRLGQTVYILVFYTFHFLGFFHWTVSNLFFFFFSVKTISTSAPTRLSLVCRAGPVINSVPFGRLRNSRTLLPTGTVLLNQKTLLVSTKYFFLISAKYCK